MFATATQALQFRYFCEIPAALATLAKNTSFGVFLARIECAISLGPASLSRATFDKSVICRMWTKVLGNCV